MPPKNDTQGALLAVWKRQGEIAVALEEYLRIHTSAENVEWQQVQTFVSAQATELLSLKEKELQLKKDWEDKVFPFHVEEARQKKHRMLKSALRSLDASVETIHQWKKKLLKLMSAANHTKSSISQYNQN